MSVNRDQILEYLSQCPEGAELKDILKAVGKPTSDVSPILSGLKAVNWVESLSQGMWRITELGMTGVKKAPKPPVNAPITAPNPITNPSSDPGDVMVNSVTTEGESRGPVPGAYEKFAQIGRSLGIRDDFLKSVTDYIFTGDVTNLSFVWDALNGLFLRPDVTKRWFNMWSRVINMPIPSEIASQMMPASTTAAKEAEIKAPTKFSVIGDEILADPDGEFTFSMARQYLMTKAALNVAPDVGSDKISDILGAITPFLVNQQSAKTAEITAQGENSTQALIIKYLLESKDNKNGNVTPPLGLTDVLTLVEKLESMRKPQNGDIKPPDAFSELERLMNMFNMMKGMFGGNSSTPAPVTISIKGEDGTTGALPLETFFALDNHKRAVKREDDEAESKKEMGKSVRGFMDKISKAASNMASRKE